MSRADLVTLGTERENATAPGCPAGATAWEGRWPLGGRGGFSAAPTQPWELCLGKRLLLSRQQTVRSPQGPHGSFGEQREARGGLGASGRRGCTESLGSASDSLGRAAENRPCGMGGARLARLG